MVAKNENGFHRGDPVTFELSGIRYVGVFQDHKSPNNAYVLVIQQGDTKTNFVMLAKASSLRRLESELGVE